METLDNLIGPNRMIKTRLVVVEELFEDIFIFKGRLKNRLDLADIHLLK